MSPNSDLLMRLAEQALPVVLIVGATLIFLTLERIRPGRELPHVSGWHVRAALMNLMQLALIGAGGVLWNRCFREHALLSLGH